jgi:hypothetical protein
MKTDTHTQGKWRSYGCTVYSGEMVIAGSHCEGNRNLRRCLSSDDVPNSEGLCGEGWDEALANARLIAAAPEMLAALQSLTHPMASDEDLQNALAIIAKVKGGDA